MRSAVLARILNLKYLQQTHGLIRFWRINYEMRNSIPRPDQGGKV
jgi:hypothetical protein